MPNYIAHSVMGEIVKIPNNKINIDRTFLKVFSLGQDLVAHTPTDCHNVDTDLFFLNLISYIIENKLYEDAKVMAYLYGNIMHYELDKKAHPYIYYMTNDIKERGLVGFHMACEEYLGDLLLKNKLHLSRKDFVVKSKNIDFTDCKILKRTVNDIYLKTYKYKSAFSYIKRILVLFKLLSNTRNILDKIDPNLYFNLLFFDKYIEEISLKAVDLLNCEHREWFNPISGEKSSDSFIEVFDKAVFSSEEVMSDVNRVIYGNMSMNILHKIFDNTSYDTGLSCKIGKPFVYSYSKKIKI